jgi:hypothetical protein
MTRNSVAPGEVLELSYDNKHVNSDNIIVVDTMSHRDRGFDHSTYITIGGITIPHYTSSST